VKYIYYKTPPIISQKLKQFSQINIISQEHFQWTLSSAFKIWTPAQRSAWSTEAAAWEMQEASFDSRILWRQLFLLKFGEMKKYRWVKKKFGC
jgi:hypothetical protein